MFLQVPEAEQKTVNMIDALANPPHSNKINAAYLLATEGTIQSEIYQNTFQKYGISVDFPTSTEWAQMRYFIEIVKQGRVTQDVKEYFRSFCTEIPYENIILGSTEFAVLLYANEIVEGKALWDPLDSVIDYIKSIIK